MDNERIYRRSLNTAWVQSSPQRFVLLRLDEPTARPFALEGTSAAIWECIDGYRDVSDIALRLASVFEISVGEIEDQVATFIEHIASLGFVELGSKLPQNELGPTT
jgi:hypothetical protein